MERNRFEVTGGWYGIVTNWPTLYQAWVKGESCDSGYSIFNTDRCDFAEDYSTDGIGDYERELLDCWELYERNTPEDLDAIAIRMRGDGCYDAANECANMAHAKRLGISTELSSLHSMPRGLFDYGTRIDTGVA